ncbi:unnamed protein product [Cylindrotheca closterium]|uniref:N-acetyltransferase domain-containing protein n=1 Tax=Cylindrotheca closterium TaxID=2856 RepID=A0AAD2CJ60_9STRA|nr:unnamed protein product [Cylindrotheca closterium]
MCLLLTVQSILFLQTLAFQQEKFAPSLRNRVASTMNAAANEKIVSDLTFRRPLAEDIPTCFEIESASYPGDEAASLDSLYNRQSNAGDYFQCAIFDGNIVGFVCATRCSLFEEESMSTHDPEGKLLAIHSVVVQEKYRRKGIASAMLKCYVEKVQVENIDGSIESMVLLAKAHLLGFYVKCGFQVNRPSPIVHGQELWFELEKSTVRGLPLDGQETWFCKTETFKRPFPEVKPHLEAHKDWVKQLRQHGYCITSGYRVDSEGKPGGGGLMFLAAKSYDAAQKLVLQDPLVASDCVDWQLNGWIGQVGDIQMR